MIKFVDLEISYVSPDPDYWCDVYVEDATALYSDGSFRAATEDELEKLSEDTEMMHELIGN